jgi:glycosyltransferase involved in cell wall biosynthesis
MRITLLSTFDTYGGAGIAASRLLGSLREAGHEAHLLVQQHKGQQAGVVAANPSWVGKYLAQARFATERALFVPHERDISVRFTFSPANVGIDLSQHPLVQSADVLHLHWVNFGFLSLKSLENLFKLGKPVVWTLHDEWAFTGGCHYAGTCRGFEHTCGHCLFLRHPAATDLSHRIWQRKANILTDAPLHVVACSEWLASEARRSSLLGGYPILSIPNPIDAERFAPQHPHLARKALGLPTQKPLILFVAMNVQDERKGFRYFKEALGILHAEAGASHEAPELLVVGKSQTTDFDDVPFRTHHLGSITSATTMAQVYNAASVFVIPSLEDNLPNTVMEALACGTPVVGFDTGGIPEMVQHLQHGFIAPQRNATALAQGMRWVLDSAAYDTLSSRARAHVLAHYSPQVVAEQYVDLYKKTIQL